MNKFTFKKSLGQNFLHNHKIAEKIVMEAEISSADFTIEIGCGNGFLTRKILDKKPKFLIIIELDGKCIDLARENLKNHEHFSVLKFIQMDAQNLKISQFDLPQKPVIISNLPYSTGSRILIHLLSQSNLIEKMTIMLQKEVVQRIVSPENTKDYGILSVISQTFWKCSARFDVSRGNFKPSPAVTSSVVNFTNFVERIEISKFWQYLAIIKQIFSQRRKMLRVFMPEMIKKFPEISQKRAGELGIEKMIEIMCAMK